jgi:Fur family ferric uptake transcriptional regulator
MRWTPQRRAIVEALAGTRGHVTGAELLERCRALDPQTIPSTVYRTLDVLEEMGLVRHGHGVDGREEFHVSAEPEHGHLYCQSCGGRWEIGAPEAQAILAAFRATTGFEPELSHMTIVGRCAACAAQRESSG